MRSHRKSLVQCVTLGVSLGSLGLFSGCGSTPDKSVRRGIETPAGQEGSLKAPPGGFDASRVVAGTDFHPDGSAQAETSADVNSQVTSGVSGGSTSASWDPRSTELVSSTGRVVSPAGLPRAAGAVTPQEIAAPTQFDANFCRGLAQGECFTLVLQIPSPLLAQSLGLSILNLVQFSPSYRGMLSRTCNEGLEVSWRHLLADQGVGLVHKQGVLKRAFPNVKRVRCVLQNITSEDSSPPSLGQNEHGVAVRVVDFSIESRSSSTAPAFGTFEFKNSRMVFRFRDPSAYVASVGGRRAWRPVAGYDTVNVLRQSGVFPTATKRVNFSDSLRFDFNLQGSARYVHHVLMPVIDSASQGEGLGKLGLQLAVIRRQLAVLAAGSNPVVPSLILAGIGIDAVRDLCAFEASDCRIRTTGENVGQVISRTYQGGDPIPSDTKATFVDATKYIPFALMSAVVEGMDKHAYLSMVRGN